MDPTYEMKRSVQAEGLDGGTGHYRAGSPERPSKLGRPSPDRPPVEAQALSTPIAKERRSSEVSSVLSGGSEMRSARRSLHAAGPQTFDRKYMPFAAGFAHMSDEAAVYRSTRLHTINPTAAVTDDISYYYTLDSGRTPPAALAANPDTHQEFVRNTASATQGGAFRRLMKPIR